MKKFMFMLMMLFCGNAFGQINEPTPDIDSWDYYFWMSVITANPAINTVPTFNEPVPDPISTPNAVVLNQEECDDLRGLLVLTNFAIEEQKVITQTASTNWENLSNQTATAYSNLMQSYMVVPYNEQNTNQLRTTWQALTAKTNKARDDWNNARTLLSMIYMLRSEYQKQLEDGGCGYY